VRWLSPELPTGLPWWELSPSRGLTRWIAYKTNTEEHARIEGVIAGGAVGGLIGMLFGPLATLVCAAVGAEIGRRSGAHGKAP
jgi:hypothetical protein